MEVRKAGWLIDYVVQRPMLVRWVARKYNRELFAATFENLCEAIDNAMRTHERRIRPR